MLHNGKNPEEIEKIIQEFKGNCSEEELPELFYLSIWNKVVLKRSGVDKDLMELEKLNCDWGVKGNILQLR